MKWNSEISQKLDNLLKTSRTKAVAVFDADGTLWPDDLGEGFFKHQIQFQLAPGLKGLKSPWESYAKLDKVSTADANAWIAKLNAGIALTELRDQAKKFYIANFRQKLNPLMVDLIGKMKANHFEIWVCSASMRWAIEPALYDLDIPLDRLIGTESEVDKNGKLTTAIKSPIPYADGKKRALEEHLRESPVFVAGNSTGDLPMLTLAKEMALVIQYLPSNPDIEGSELALRQEAERRQWPIQIFQA